ncbi:MAG TPA: adenosylcobinamide-GDP ribazoletransferase [Solirubrobacteraceae bacterium]
MSFPPPPASLRLAVSFLTVVPVRPREARVAALGAAAAWFPLVGGVLGAVAGGVDYVLAPSLGPTVAAILAVGALVAVTGGLHQDGLADCADGLGARGDRERRLAIMRDSSIGTFGALALILWLMLIVSAVAGLDRADALRALVVAAGAGRWAALVHARTATPARPDGLGAGFRVGDWGLALGSGSAVVIAGVLVGPIHGLVVLGLAAAVGLVISVWSRRTVGGRTGDTLGASVALTEVAVLVTLLGVGLR